MPKQVALGHKPHASCGMGRAGQGSEQGHRQCAVDGAGRCMQRLAEMPTAQMRWVQLGTQLLGQHRQLLLEGLAAGRAQGDQCLEAAFSWDTVRHQLDQPRLGLGSMSGFSLFCTRASHLRLAEHGTCTQGWWEEARSRQGKGASQELTGGSGNWNPPG